MKSNNFCLCVLSGLPAAGKTSLCNLLEELIQVVDVNSAESMVAVHMCYDEIIHDLDLKSEPNQDQSLWKECRRQIVSGLDLILKELSQEKTSLHHTTLQRLLRDQIMEDSSNRLKMAEVTEAVGSRVAKVLMPADARTEDEQVHRNILFLIDDNMFYRSMRYEYFQLARKYLTGFCQVGLSCSTRTALARNAGRSNKIPDETIITMATKMELPDASQAPWEKNSIIIDALHPVDHAILAPVWMLVKAAFQSPVPPLEEEDVEAKEESRAQVATSLLHQADQTLRKCISEEMASAKTEAGKDMRLLAKQLGEAKTDILGRLREGSLIAPPLPQGADQGGCFDIFIRECLHQQVP